MISIFDLGPTVGYATATVPAMVSIISPAGVVGSARAGMAVTRVTITRRAGATFAQTASPLSYASIFHERLGDASITGLLYSQRCVAPYGLPAASLLNWIYYYHGMSQMALPLYIWMAGGGVYAYLTSCAIAADSQTPHIISFVMSLKVL